MPIPDRLLSELDKMSLAKYMWDQRAIPGTVELICNTYLGRLEPDVSPDDGPGLIRGYFPSRGAPPPPWSHSLCGGAHIRPTLVDGGTPRSGIRAAKEVNGEQLSSSVFAMAYPTLVGVSNIAPLLALSCELVGQNKIDAAPSAFVFGGVA